ncbi:MAG: hypothetical protein UY61_C0066G0004 [Candidatus Adlerbacteria bacterium GW2011_GWC1_50_9]|uniref:Uncharacterized protein n=1 Tax=Candidatus Adlerbacteria bacterium GW2011_GWC1_50_9 TaxID=1618608 RepID=A0A0G1WJX0_9BACT|nr:MAG: hypothetical protein UY61_C0066G0004 [Candidatus Adlerbacteria bacterium GW2011_GWC1_50_9]
MTTDAESRDEAVSKFRNMMDKGAIGAHFEEKHSGEPIPSKREVDDMIEKTTDERRARCHYVINDDADAPLDKLRASNGHRPLYIFQPLRPLESLLSRRRPHAHKRVRRVLKGGI